MQTMKLKRYPFDPKDLLQAWDASDELILEHFKALIGESRPKILILNDQFGALACGLEGHDLTVYTDSYLSCKGIQLNSEGKITPINDLQKLNGPYDYVLIHIPKNMSFFEDMLCHISAHLKPTSKVISGFMIKHQSKASFDLLNKYIGETSTSLAKKKARLILADFQKSKVQSPYPLQLTVRDAEHDFDHPLVNHSNLFSREKLDVGTRFLLEHIPAGGEQGKEFETILDLGCGNGIIGIAAKMMNPKAKIIFADESEMAIQSAKANYSNYFPKKLGDAEFIWTHSYRDEVAKPVDLILCNPPFHQGNAVSDVTAWQMFKDSHRALKKNGTLRVIGNSQLLYQNSMKKIFGNSQYVAKNSKFTIVDSIKDLIKPTKAEVQPD
jgi:23S rRNA (guanine1835-N2)-methyltransferase